MNNQSKEDHKPFLVFDSSQDADLTPFRACTLYTETVRKGSTDDWTYKDPSDPDPSTLFQQIHFPALASRLSLETGIYLNSQQVYTLMDFCAFDISLYKARQDRGICSLFSEDEINLYQIISDLKTFDQSGYGHALNARMMCSLFTGIADAMLDKHRGNPESKELYLRFAHAETVMPFLSFLGLYDGIALSPWMSIDLLSTRKWISSSFSPFAANVVLESWECLDNDWQVRLRINEESVDLPKCPNGACSLEMFLEIYAGSIGCSFDAECKVNLGHTLGGWNGYGKGRSRPPQTFFRNN